MLKLKFVRKTTSLDISNISLEIVMFNTKEISGILDLRSIRNITKLSMVFYSKT